MEGLKLRMDQLTLNKQECKADVNEADTSTVSLLLSQCLINTLGAKVSSLSTKGPDQRPEESQLNREGEAVTGKPRSESEVAQPVTSGTTKEVTAISGLTSYTIEEVSNHCSPDSCWIVLWDHVYDVTNFVKEHPGGEEIIYEHAGRDATYVFRDVGHSHDALLMITKFLIGILAEEDRVHKRKKLESYCF